MMYLNECCAFSVDSFDFTSHCNEVTSVRITFNLPSTVDKTDVPKILLFATANQVLPSNSLLCPLSTHTNQLQYIQTSLNLIFSIIVSSPQCTFFPLCSLCGTSVWSGPSWTLPKTRSNISTWTSCRSAVMWILPTCNITVTHCFIKCEVLTLKYPTLFVLKVLHSEILS